MSKRFTQMSLAAAGLIALATWSLAGENPPELAQWLKAHRPESFDGQVYARFRLTEPADFLYGVIVDSETNPYKPSRLATGTVFATGLKPRPWEGAEDWGKPMPWVAPATDADWLKTGQWSPWVKLPTSKAAQWHTAFIVRPKDEKASKEVKASLEFATQPEESAIFHAAEDTADSTGTITVRMPTAGGLDGLRMVSTYEEWARQRAEIVRGLKLGPPPRLKALRVRTYADLTAYRSTAGAAPTERARLDFANFQAVGINALTIGGLKDEQFRDLSREYDILDTTLVAWGGMWFYTREKAQKEYDFKEKETPEARWTRVFDDFYRKTFDSLRQSRPFGCSIATEVNLGDEIGSETNAKQIRETPELLADFRAWLQRQGGKPEDYGAKGWEEISPTDDRAAMKKYPPVEQARLFYQTRRYIDEYSTTFWRCATQAVKKNFPQARLVAVNYQAGPIQAGFLGNNNDLDNGMLDLFGYARGGAFEGVMTECWTGSQDWGVGRVSFGADLLRAIARKRDMPTAGYVVGGGPRTKIFAYLMRGVRDLELYLYGPIGSIGPAFGTDGKILGEVAAATRQMKPFEDSIAAGRVRPARAALLVAYTSEIMQARGLYFCHERQNLYTAIQHGSLPLDIVCEQDLVEDDLLKNYSLLYVVDPQVREDAQKKIAEWVKGGGALWACVGAAEWKEDSEPCAVLDPVFGVKFRRMQAPADGYWYSAASYATVVNKFPFQPNGSLRLDEGWISSKTEIPVRGPKLEAEPSTAQVVGRYEGGKPAAFLNRHGKGQALLVGMLAGEAYANAHWPEKGRKDGGGGDRDSQSVYVKGSSGSKAPEEFLLGSAERELVLSMVGRAGIRPPLALSVPGIYSSLMDIPDGVLLFLDNATERPVPGLRVRLQATEKPKSVESTAGPLRFEHKDGELSFELDLPSTEIIRVKR
jgi:hypothetical protein